MSWSNELFANMKEGVDMNSLSIPANFTFICCVNKKKMAENVSYLKV